MTFTTVPFAFVGGSYESAIRPYSSQDCINMYTMISNKGKDPAILRSFPGQSLQSSVDGDLERGCHNMNEVMYRVVDNKLYSVDKNYAHTLLNTGSIKVGGTSRCIFADDGENLVIVSDKVYVYNSTTNNFSANNNVNLKGVISVDFIKSQFIYTTPDLTFVSAPLDPFDVSGLNAVSAESNPDKLVRDYAFNQVLYRFGQRTCEPWYVSGVGSPPIDVIEGRQFSVGLGAIHSIAHTDNALYWLGDDKAIYRTADGSQERISDDAIYNQINKMTKIDDAFGYVLTIQGMDFYVITFPSGNKTYLLNERLGVFGWSELRSGEDSYYSATSSVLMYDKNIVCKNGQVLTLEDDAYTQDSDVTFRRRTGLPITRKNIPSRIKGRRIKISCIEFIMEQGVGLIDGQGERPRMLLELSMDGGRSYAHSQWVELGQMGEHTLEVVADAIISADEIVPRITLTDPVPLSISATNVDIKAVAR